MQIKDTEGNILVINADAKELTVNVSVNNGYIFTITLDQVRKLLPSLQAARQALEEADVVRRKNKLDDLRSQIDTIKAEIEEIEALK
jgi:hypothetical protein